MNKWILIFWLRVADFKFSMIVFVTSTVSESYDKQMWKVNDKPAYNIAQDAINSDSKLSVSEV